MYIHTCIHTCICVYVYVYMSAYIHTYMCVCVCRLFICLCTDLLIKRLYRMGLQSISPDSPREAPVVSKEFEAKAIADSQVFHSVTVGSHPIRCLYKAVYMTPNIDSSAKIES